MRDQACPRVSPCPFLLNKGSFPEDDRSSQWNLLSNPASETEATEAFGKEAGRYHVTVVPQEQPCEGHGGRYHLLLRGNSSGCACPKSSGPPG